MKPGKDYIGVFVAGAFHDGKGNVLMGRRSKQARDDHGMWEFGGGTAEVGESLSEALIRETKEEFGTEPYDLKQVMIRDLIKEKGHWLGVYFVGRIDPDKVYIAEPCYDEIAWFKKDEMPSPVREGERGNHEELVSHI